MQWVGEARAVLEAIREPTHEMYMIGGNAQPYNRAQDGRKRGRRIGDLPARDAWRRMVDKALQEDVNSRGMSWESFVASEPHSDISQDEIDWHVECHEREDQQASEDAP